MSTESSGEVIGRIITPPGKEATPDEFYFWAEEGKRVEKTQIVVTEVEFPDEKVKYYGVIDTVSRVAEDVDIHADRMRRSGDPNGGRRVGGGTTYAKVSILASFPEVFTPPLEGGEVRFASPAEAAHAYGFDRIKLGAPIGLLRNGASRTAGPAIMDLAYLLGENGAHLNVNGVSGVATKTSALLVLIQSVLQTVERQRRESPSSEHLTVVPVLFNVKGLDMLWLDKPSKVFAENPEHVERWREMGLEPKPFENVEFRVPAVDGSPNTPQQVVRRRDLVSYSWGLADIIEQGLLPFLFSSDDKANQNFSHLLNTIEERLTGWQNGRRVLKPREAGMSWNRPGQDYEGGTPQTFEELVTYFQRELAKRDGDDRDYSSGMDNAHVATIRAFYRRLRRVQRESGGVIAWRHVHGNPPTIRPGGEASMYVIDIASLARSSDMQRFVIAAVLNALKEERTSRNAARGIRYLVTLDELNQWAPRGSQDATTQLFEKVAAEMRSIGIILLGAQQFASKISMKVAENASCKLVGRTGPGELSDQLWRFLSDADKQMVSRLKQGEQLFMMPPFRAPANVLIPFPAWAMRREEVLQEDEIALEASEGDDGVVGLTIDTSGSSYDDF